MTTIYTHHGWTPTGAAMVAFVGTALLVLLARGPHETAWIGWRGGRQLLKKEKLTDLSPEAITEGIRIKAGRRPTQGDPEAAEAAVEVGDVRR